MAERLKAVTTSKNLVQVVNASNYASWL